MTLHEAWDECALPFHDSKIDYKCLRAFDHEVNILLQISIYSTVDIYLSDKITFK